MADLAKSLGWGDRGQGAPALAILRLARDTVGLLRL